SRPRLASSSNAIIFAAIGSSPPWRTRGSSRRPRRTATRAAVPSRRGRVPRRPIPPSCWHSHKESASTMFSTLLVRVQTPQEGCGRWCCRDRRKQIGPAPEGRAGQQNPADLWSRAKRGPRANLRDHDHLVGLRAPVALRDLELDPLSLFEGAVAIRLDRREMDENVLATVDGDKAVSLVRVEPFDGALSHSKQL